MRIWFSLSCFVFAFSFTIYGLNTLDLFDFNGRPGPGYFPLIIGIGLILCTGINLYKDGKARKQLVAPDGGLEQESQVYVKDTLAVSICIALLIITLNTLGAIISMVAFCFAFLSYFNRGKLVQNISYSIVFPMSVYLLFDVWLQAGLPSGLLRVFY